MKTQYAVALGVVAGIGLGAAAVQGLHAQAKPPVFYVAEIDVSNPEAYAKEYAPKARAIIEAGGGKFLALAGAGTSGPKVTALDGEPPKRVAIQVWGSLEKLEASFNSAEYREARKIGEKYAKFRSFAVDGLPQ
jgi:uncharacterized protein (DUF1330 family)